MYIPYFFDRSTHFIINTEFIVVKAVIAWNFGHFFCPDITVSLIKPHKMNEPQVYSKISGLGRINGVIPSATLK